MKPYKPIRSLLQDNKALQANRIAPSVLQSSASQLDLSFLDSEAVQANWIAPSAQRSRTSQSDRSFRTTKPYKPIVLLLQDYKVVQTNQITPNGLRSRTSQLDSSRSLRRSSAWSSEKIKSLAWSQTVRPSSLSRLHEKAVPCTHKPPWAHKSLYAQSRIQAYAISCFTRKAVCLRISFIERISRLRAKPYSHVRNKSHYMPKPFKMPYMYRKDAHRFHKILT